MIDGEPRVSERDGTRVVVDASGDEVVCRRKTPHAHGTYHRIDGDRLTQDDTIHPACRVTGVNDDNWDPVKRATIDRTWDGCGYQQCYGPDHDHETAQQTTGGQLRTTLTDMTVEEFDRAVAAQKGGER
jgi:hypothetical protein